jgi:hypothetical protein
MVTIGGSWDTALLIGGVLLFLWLMFLAITRSVGAVTVSVRCPRTGDTTVLQHITDERSYLTDVVSCAAFPHGRPITCGLPCLTERIRPRVCARAQRLVTV